MSHIVLRNCLTLFLCKLIGKHSEPHTKISTLPSMLLKARSEAAFQQRSESRGEVQVEYNRTVGNIALASPLDVVLSSRLTGIRQVFCRL